MFYFCCMENKKKTTILTWFKRTVMAVVAFLALLFVLPIMFPGKIAEQVKLYANDRLNGKLNFTEAQLSFFNHFPSLTLTLKDFKLNGSTPFPNETLVSAGEIAFGINIKSLILDNEVKIDKIFLSDAFMNVKVNENGEANYNVYVSEKQKNDTKQSNTSLKLEKIDIRDTHLVYDDKSTKILIDAKGFNYIGKGALDQSIFDIYTEAEIDSLNLSYDNQVYLKNKNIKADLITKINTNSFAFLFKQNNLKINKLPVQFTGAFNFLKNGYDMDFKIDSKDSKLNDFFTALPPQYVSWLEKAKVKGRTDLGLSLKGQYIASQNKSPDLTFQMKVREGEIEYKNAPFPASNIYLNFDTRIPALNPDNISVTIDSLFFNVGKDYLKAIVKTKGLKKPVVQANIQTAIDLKKMDQAFGFQNMNLSGLLKMNLIAGGTYDQERRTFPKAKGFVSLQRGFIQTAYYPTPISKINLNATISNGDGTFKQTKVKVSPASFVFEGNPIFVKASFENFDDVAYDLKAKGTLDIGRIYKVFSQKGLGVKGFVKADVSFKGKQSDAVAGRYDRLNNTGTLLLKNIKTTSVFLPKPFVINEGLFTFNKDKMNFSNFVASYGQSDFKMNGYLQNVIHFVLSDREVLKGKFILASNFLNVDEFMTGTATGDQVEIKQSETKGSPQAESGVIVIPSNFDLQFVAQVAKVNFNDLILEKAKGDLTISEGKLQIKNSGFSVIDCPVNMNILYRSESPKRASFDFDVKANDFDIKRAYDEIKLFREMATAAETAQGKVSLDYKLSGKLDSNMQPVFPSLKGGGVLSIKEVKVRGFKLFGAVSRKTNTEAIKNPDLSKVDIRTSIKNNIITVERFKFKFAGFRPRIEGTTSFDGRLNLKMRLGLPPLGIIGIPLTVTGTQEAPKVRLGKKTEDLQETEYEESVDSTGVKVSQPPVPGSQK